MISWKKDECLSSQDLESPLIVRFDKKERQIPWPSEMKNWLGFSTNQERSYHLQEWHVTLKLKCTAHSRDLDQYIASLPLHSSHLSRTETHKQNGNPADIRPMKQCLAMGRRLLKQLEKNSSEL